MARKRSGQRVTPRKGRSAGQRSSQKLKNIIPHRWTLCKFDALSDRQRDTYFCAKRVIDEARSGKSPSQAARDNKTTLATVSRYFPEDFKKGKRCAPFVRIEL